MANLFDLDSIESYVGKKVNVWLTHDAPDENGSTEEHIYGQLQAVSEIGLMVKPKGSQTGRLVFARQITKVALDVTTRTIKPKTLRPVDLSTVRAHLADRHGVELQWINTISDADALEVHKNLDHRDLTHIHGD